jgi:predicted  nucleic acid-binding Zn-ribbon protein
MNFDKTNLPVISDSRLALLESQFHQAYERDIAKPRESLVADLDEKYIAALGRAEDAASRAGNSVELARLKEEKQRVQSKVPIPSAETEPLPASLKQLRATYADSIAKIDRDIDAKSSSLFNELDRQFGVLQQSLAMEHRDELVELIKVRRDQIAGKKLWH